MRREEITNFIKNEKSHGIGWKGIEESMPSFIAKGIADQNDLIEEQNKHLESVAKALWAIAKKPKK